VISNSPVQTLPQRACECLNLTALAVKRRAVGREIRAKNTSRRKRGVPFDISDSFEVHSYLNHASSAVALDLDSRRPDAARLGHGG
jgi:hypothetical protein